MQHWNYIFNFKQAAPAKERNPGLNILQKEQAFVLGIVLVLWGRILGFLGGRLQNFDYFKKNDLLRKGIWCVWKDILLFAP